MSLKLSVFYVLCYTLSYIESARILAVFPTPSFSHQVVYRPLTQELARRGHEVTVITTDPVFPKGGAPENFTEIDVRKISYSMWNNVLTKMEDSSKDAVSQIEVILKTFLLIFKEQMKTEDVQAVLTYKNDYFDLLIIEAIIRPTLGFSHVFKAPAIQISSLGSTLDDHDIIGSSIHPFLYPSILRDRLYNLTMWEKIIQLEKEVRLRMVVKNQEITDNKAMKGIFGRNMPNIQELKENIELLYLNVHPLWDSNRPVPPGVIYMGGLHQSHKKELPQELQTYLDSSKNGVIYFSLGTNIKPCHVPSEKLKAILKVFSRLPYNFLWKWDNDELPERYNNIKISKWLPQSDLLRHPKIKLFVTQGGLQSTDEAITAGVPLIGIPMLADQWYNVEKYVYYKIGLGLDINTLTEEILESAINSVLNDSSYRKNIVKLRKLMQDQPQTPLERAVWWTEYVLRHGGARHLRSPAANISWAEYLELDLVFTLAVISIICLIVLIVISKAIWNFIRLKVSTIVKVKVA